MIILVQNLLFADVILSERDLRRKRDRRTYVFFPNTSSAATLAYERLPKEGIMLWGFRPEASRAHRTETGY